MGIARENLEKIFQHGFTTKKKGHGFGLHSCAIAAQELGGSLNVESDGVSKGATFTLKLPLTTASRNDGDCDETVPKKQPVEKSSLSVVADLAVPSLTDPVSSYNSAAGNNF